MAFKMKYQITTSYLPLGTRRSGALIPEVLFIVSHDTGNDGTTARANVNYYKNTYNIDPKKTASAHTFIDDKEIIECIPATTGKPEKAWHVRYDCPDDNKFFGDDANDSAIGVELCYSHNKGSINNKEAYKRYVWYHAYLCYKFNLDPRKKITGHCFLDPTRKLDPAKNAFKVMGVTWEKFIQDVVNEYADCTRVEQPNQSAPQSKKEMVKVDAKTIQEAKKAIDELSKAGLLTSPDYWKERVEENIPVWAYMIIEARKLKK
jgi:N-acetylmuramoyl-L-alanine amidase